jgi:tRNA dimethylallyltransferase
MAPLKTLFIVGPTASGKTAVALRLAKALNGEIICADSRTIYVGLNIATAKPTSAEQAAVRHHGLDVVKPNEAYSAAQFQALAKEAIADITNRGKLPIIVGGTGLYIDGLLFDYQFGDANPALRAELEPLSIEELQERITKAGIEMPENKQNKRYLQRALEQQGINKKSLPEPVAGALVIGLNPGKDVIKGRITKRAKEMLEDGALQEAEELFNEYGYEAPAVKSTFYRAFRPHFEEGVAAKDCIEQFMQNDRHLAKRQLTWFKRNSHINWFESGDLAYDFVLQQAKTTD